MKLRWCMLLVGILCLAMLPALAASPDLGTLRYIPPQAPTAELSETTQPGSRVIPLDLWMDATPNMGGINLVEDTLYPTGSSAKYYQGGFITCGGQLPGVPRLVRGSAHRPARAAGPPAQPGACAALRRRAFLGRAAGQVRPDGLHPRGGGLPAKGSAHLGHPGHGETFTEMVQPGPENFYAPGTASAARADQVQLENPAQAQALLAVQQEGLALQQAGDPSALVNREEGGSHLLTRPALPGPHPPEPHHPGHLEPGQPGRRGGRPAHRPLRGGAGGAGLL